MLWRGVQINKEALNDYQQKKWVAEGVRLQGNYSFSRNLKVALKFAFQNAKSEHLPTLFVIACQNYNQPRGFLMSNEAYSAYPSESEFVFMEGCLVYVLAV